LALAATLFASAWTYRARPEAVFLLAIGSLLCYGGFSLLLNQAVFRIRNGYMEVSHRPFPWPGRRIAVSEIEALNLEVYDPARGEGVLGYQLEAVLKSGKRFRLAWGPIGGHRFDRMQDAARRLSSISGIPLL